MFDTFSLFTAAMSVYAVFAALVYVFLFLAAIRPYRKTRKTGGAK